MSPSLRRLAPLTGIIFAALLVVTFLTSHSPSVKDSGTQVISYYQRHHSRNELGDLLSGLGVVFFLFWISYLRTYFRDRAAGNGGDGLSLAMLVGGIFIGVGGALFASIDFALASDRTHLTPQAAVALNVMNDSFFFPFEIGLVVFALCLGLTVLATAALPKWLGWVMIVVGVAAFTPVGFFGFFLVLLWTAIVSIMLFMRHGSQGDRPAGGQAPAPATGTP